MLEPSSRLGRKGIPFLGIVLALSLISFSTIFARLSVGQPNIVLIVSDDAGYNDFGFMANLNGRSTDVRTPNLDALAAQSLVMSSAYASGPVCSPARAALLAGMYQQRIGYEDNPGDTEGLPAGQQLVSHHLQSLGYSTGAIGKWHLGETDEVNRPLDMGFDEFFGFLGGGRPYWGGYGDNGRAIRRGDTSIESEWATEGDAGRYDPINGRYLTDAFGEEAADFIDRHAGDEEPFFLYVALNAAHTPLDATQADKDQFSGIEDSRRRTLAAMTYAMDRAVGDITDALTANGLDENTILVFMNDNGGPDSSVAPYSNGPLRGNKGSLREGGIRVPMMIKAPGVQAGVYDEAVVSRDLIPTFINAAGGVADDFGLDGTDLMPYLEVDVAGQPHEIMFWRHMGGRFAVRKGDWKLVRPGSATSARLHNVATDIHEDVTLNNEHPEVVTELLRELTFWEATLRKPEWGALGDARNQFDHFVFRNDVAAASNWSTANVWKQAGTDNNATFLDEDSYANAILEFPVRNDRSYTATNNMRRMTYQTFMLNQIRLTGEFVGASNRTGTVNGNALLFVKNLDGQLPTLQLDATSNGSAADFKFALNTELRLLDDLEITGDGSEQFVIGGNIRDYFEPRSVIKSGTSNVTLAGSNTFGGGLVINGGRVITSNIRGTVENNGGTFSPGPALGLASIGGFTQNQGVLEIELGGTLRGSQYDGLVADGNLSLGGTLQVSLVDGFVPQANQAFRILDWTGELSGDFSAIELPALANHLRWNTTQLYSGGLLSVKYSEVPGDVNQDNSSDAADYVAWRKQPQFDLWRARYGETDAAGDDSSDLNHDGAVDAADFVIWRKSGGDLNEWHTFFGEASVEMREGDYNGDGAIDAADFVAWRKTDQTTRGYVGWHESFGDAIPTAAESAGDFNSDAAMDAADYAAWRKVYGKLREYDRWSQNFGQSLPADLGTSNGVAAVPEPSTTLPIVVAMLLAVGSRRKRERWLC